MEVVANGRRSFVVAVGGGVEKPRNREGGTWEGDDHGIEVASRTTLLEVGVRRVVQEVVLPPPPDLSIVVDLLDFAPTKGSRTLRKAVSAVIRAGEQIEQAIASDRFVSEF